jgi:hypothetical protein
MNTILMIMEDMIRLIWFSDNAVAFSFRAGALMRDGASGYKV